MRSVSSLRFVVVVMVVIAGLVAPVRASAIPMWEYLSRGEKVRLKNILYSLKTSYIPIFARFVFYK